MIITPYQKQFLTESLALWLGSADSENIPDTIRCLGIVVEDETTLKCFIAERFSDKFLGNISKNKQLTLAVSHPYNFSGLQYKGQLLDIRTCTPAEVKIQEKYMDEFSSNMGTFGLEKEGVYRMYFNQPSLALRMRIDKIFDQAPKEGTGGEAQV